MMTVFIILVLLFLILVSILIVNGVDEMKEKHPDYKGEDFLDWDDNKQHTENV